MRKFVLKFDPFTPIVTPLKGLVQRHRVHFIILLVALVYFSIAPVIYARYYITLGEPVKFENALPPPSNEIISAIDDNEDIIIDGKKTHKITGWAFLDGEPDQSKYEKFLVLKSDQRTYLFKYDLVKRPDVLAAFKEKNLDILYSGFYGLISGDLIRSGVYNVGFFFLEKDGQKSFYSTTNRYLIRSPNHITMKIGAIPYPDKAGNSFLQFEDALQDGFGIHLNQVLPAPTEEIRYSLDGIGHLSLNSNSVARLVGWSFILNDFDQTHYERFLVLESDKETYFFPTLPNERTDIQKAFAVLNLNLQYSGFETFIQEDVLQTGTYAIGILFRDTANGSVFYSETSNTLTRSSNQLTLR